MRINLRFGISDFYWNLMIYSVYRANIECFCILPMTVVMAYIIPKRIESGMFSLVTGILYFSTDWGSQMVGSLICYIYGVDKDVGGERYSEILVCKVPLLMCMILLTSFLTLNEDIANLAKRIRRHQYISEFRKAPDQES